MGFEQLKKFQSQITFPERPKATRGWFHAFNMTIDGEWIVSLKKDIPHAFTPRAGFTPQAIFSDCQIRLMQPVTENTETWDDYIFRQYEAYIRRCFTSVSTVIVAFDDYQHVPLAKAMTQSKRRQRAPPIDFSDRDVLPVVVPSKDMWPLCMANRTFKTRLIHLITHTLGKWALHDLSPNQTLIIDWTFPPLLFRGGAVDAEPLTEMAALGESDVKFARYGEMFPQLQVDSIDGDNIPIALLKMETGFQGNFSIFHLETRVEPLSRKRLVTGEPAPPSKPKRVYEHVNIRVLYTEILRRVVPRSSTPRGHAISMLVALIGVSGTDFTRGLPLVSGKSLYQMIPELWPALSRAYDPDTHALDPDRALDTLFSHIYHLKFAKHSQAGGFADVRRQISSSRLSERTKESLPSEQVLRCNARNINWLLSYWRESQYPDPIQALYGFARRSGKICHDD